MNNLVHDSLPHVDFMFDFFMFDVVTKTIMNQWYYHDLAHDSLSNVTL